MFEFHRRRRRQDYAAMREQPESGATSPHQTFLAMSRYVGICYDFNLARVLIKLAQATRKSISMKHSSQMPRRWLIIAAIAALALVGYPLTPSFAQRDPLDLAQAGFLAKDRKDFATAVRLFDDALKHGAFEDKQRGLILYSRGVSYEALGFRDRALADFDAAIVLLPEFPNVYLYRGIVWGDKGQYERALQDFLTASRLGPADPLVFNNLGNAYEGLGDLDRAIESFGRALNLRTDYAQAYYNRARTYALKQDRNRAIADYDKAISLQPLFADAYVNRAILRLMLRDFDGAMSDLDTAIRLNPGNVTALTNRATTNLALEKYEDALSDFNQAMQIAPGNPSIYLGRGRAHLFAGSLESSIADLRTAVRLRPASPYPVIWLHIARVHKGEDDRVEFAENIKKVANDAWPSPVLGLYLGTRDVEAVKEAALQGSPLERIKRDCEARFFLGEFALHNGDASRARDTLRELVSVCGPEEVVYGAAIAESKLAPAQ